MNRKYLFVTSGLLLAILINLGGCARSTTDNAPRNSAAQTATPGTSPSPIPKNLTPADLTKLRWIEGTWRGTGGDVPPFYERYEFENESTLVVETLADEKLSSVTDTSRFVLKDGHFGYSTADSGSVATALDDKSITFAPLGKARNSFRWQRESDNLWKAVLNWTDNSGAAKERVYTMERWPAK